MTVTWSPAATWAPASAPPSPRRFPLLDRALATALDTIAPVAAELVAAGAVRLAERWRRPRAVGPFTRRPLPAAPRALPGSQPDDG